MILFFNEFLLLKFLWFQNVLIKFQIILTLGRYTKKVDIYAYGILLWYVFANTTRLPRNFERAPSKEELWRLVARGVRPEYIEGIDQGIWEMMEQCWSPAPEDRPEPGHISAIFDEYRKL